MAMNLGDRLFVLAYSVGPSSPAFPKRITALAQADGLEAQVRKPLRIVTLEVVAIEPLEDAGLAETLPPPAQPNLIEPGPPSFALSAQPSGYWTPTFPPHRRPSGLVIARRGLGDYQLIEPDERWPGDITHYAEIMPPPRATLPTLDEREVPK